MALLYENREAPFTWLKEKLEVTSGNLDSHAKRLDKAGYVEYGRRLTGRGFESQVRITPRGDEAFRSYRKALRRVLETKRRPEPSEDS